MWEFTDSEVCRAVSCLAGAGEISATLHPVDAASRERQTSVGGSPIQSRLRRRLHGQSVICIRALCSQSVHGRSPGLPVHGVRCSARGLLHRAPKGHVLHGGSRSRGSPHGMWDRLVEVHPRTMILTLIMSNLECQISHFTLWSFKRRCVSDLMPTR